MTPRVLMVVKQQRHRAGRRYYQIKRVPHYAKLIRAPSYFPPSLSPTRVSHASQRLGL